MLRRLAHDEELAGCQERWQLCGDVLRGAASAPAPLDFTAKVRAAVAEEPAPAAAPAARPAARWRWGAVLRWRHRSPRSPCSCPANGCLRWPRPRPPSRCSPPPHSYPHPLPPHRRRRPRMRRTTWLPWRRPCPRRRWPRPGVARRPAISRSLAAWRRATSRHRPGWWPRLRPRLQRRGRLAGGSKPVHAS